MENLFTVLFSLSFVAFLVLTFLYLKKERPRWNYFALSLCFVIFGVWFSCYTTQDAWTLLIAALMYTIAVLDFAIGVVTKSDNKDKGCEETHDEKCEKT